MDEVTNSERFQRFTRMQIVLICYSETRRWGHVLREVRAVGQDNYEVEGPSSQDGPRFFDPNKATNAHAHKSQKNHHELQRASSYWELQLQNSPLVISMSVYSFSTSSVSKHLYIKSTHFCVLLIIHALNAREVDNTFRAKPQLRVFSKNKPRIRNSSPTGGCFSIIRIGTFHIRRAFHIQNRCKNVAKFCRNIRLEFCRLDNIRLSLLHSVQKWEVNPEVRRLMFSPKMLESNLRNIQFIFSPHFARTRWV